MGKPTACGWVVPLVVLAFARVCLAAAPEITAVTIVTPANPADAKRYEKVELLVAVAGLNATAPYDPDPAQGGADLIATFTGPSGDETVCGYFDGTNWRVRFAPRELGEWKFRVRLTDSGGSGTWNGGSFTCTASPHPGFARIDGRWLRFSDGSLFFPAGHNTGWRDEVETPPLWAMKARGENLLSFWLNAPWKDESSPRSPIETLAGGLGVYNQVPCQFLDGLVDRAEAEGIYLLPTIWSHGNLRDGNHFWSRDQSGNDNGNHWWWNNVYQNLGPPKDFFLTGNSQSWRRVRNYLRYLHARWGYSRAIAGWVGVAEIDGTTGYGGDAGHSNVTRVRNWCAAVRDWFRANDRYRTNALNQMPLAISHTTTALFHNEVPGGLDMASRDNYAAQTNDTGVAQQIGADTLSMRAAGIPCFHPEFGGDVPRGATQPAHLHNGLWAGLAAGASATPLLWTDGFLSEGQHFPFLTEPTNQMGPQMVDHLEILSRFAAGLPELDDAAMLAALIPNPPASTRGWYSQNGGHGFGWVQRTNGTDIGGQTVTPTGFLPGNYRAEWFDTWDSGTVFFTTSAVTADAGGNLPLTIPTPDPARKDIAFRIRPLDEPNRTIGLLVWEDTNGDGIQAAGEGPLGGVTVRLLDNALNELATTLTSLNGHFSFQNLPEGIFVLEFAAPEGFLFTKADEGFDDTIDSDADPATGRTAPIVLSGVQMDLTQAAGFRLNVLPEIDSGPTAVPNPVQLGP